MATDRSPSYFGRLKKYLQNHIMEIFTLNILLLSINLFVVVMQGSKRPVDMWMFDSVMDAPARERFNSILKAFVSAMEKHNMTYFMYQGTLLGSFRHHGHILWDDDLDFMLKLSDRKKVIEICKNMGVQYACHDAGPLKVVKFFFRKGIEFPAEAQEADVTWPNIDISFYFENETHIWDPLWDWQGFNFPKTEVFPLVHRPFDGLLLPSPRKPERIVKRSYNITRCRTHVFSHRLLAIIPYFMTAEKNCDAIRTRVPFVNRFRNGCTITEKLQIFGWTISEFETTAPCGEEECGGECKCNTLETSVGLKTQ